MQNIMHHFRVISHIPRCSHHAHAMKAYIENFAQTLGYKVMQDDAGNVLCQKGSPQICLQAHYDMVCIGDTAHMELIQEGNILRAKNSTLGADNGMGMAIMFDCMVQFSDLECLFTADEEVGLVGASHFTLPIMSDKLLNLDGEVEGEIYIGCAGGIDVVSTLILDSLPLCKNEKIYEISAVDFLGGHSGVDIDKNIPSAIKALANELSKHSLKLISINGGERRNAIPQSAVAIVAAQETITLHDKRLSIQCLEHHHDRYLVKSEAIIKSINAFAQGVRVWDRDLDIPSVSINLGLIYQSGDTLKVDCAMRAMDDESLAILTEETCSFFEVLGYTTLKQGGHSAWKPEVGTFAKNVQAMMRKTYPKVAYKAIHAGLECGVLIVSQAKNLEAVSIGPTIYYPHSLREMCDLDSVERMAKVIREIIKG